MPSGAHLVGVEHAHRRGAAAAVLEVEERVDDPGRDRVEEVGGAFGGSVDEDRLAQATAGSPPVVRSTSGTWRM